ncbi:U4/U6.U5 tri-snRNP-associated protein 1-like [Uloborus diversus]|uniref:U4/U6.U5 tri-snRNP-associated protein 1-like n=1 Tax=Uloborus diversus TaxID=327109 RepID=UPI0024098921|nr:U4/U6.U5 tri-snRNP-associated protein 1-like [Uloborus diversus]
MGSSKKHKEKRDRKKHKKDRSRSRERSSEKSHKRAEKSSHRKERRKIPEDVPAEFDAKIVEKRRNRHSSDEDSSRRLEQHERREPVRAPSPDDDFDVDKLLDSKLSENPTDFAAIIAKRNARKRRREDAIEELRKRQMLSTREDSLERFATEQLMEEHSQPVAVKTDYSPPSDSTTHKAEIPFITDVRIKEEPPEVVEESTPIHEEFSEPQLSLSISETNKLRAKLGLKPLAVSSSIPGLEDENSEKDVMKKPAEVFVKTENISEVKRSEALREKLKVIKEKRKIEEKLKKTKGVADSDSEDESAAAWVVKHHKILQEKEMAEKRAKLLEEMDAEFGIGALMEEEFDKKKNYTSDNLKGLKINHDVGSFQEGHQIILTLRDKGVLDEEEDMLENVNILDNERYAKNVENKKRKPDYRPYEEPEYDEFGILKKKNLLSKYDEEIEGEKKKFFKIGTPAATSYVSKEQELELIRMKLKQQNEMTLEMPQMKLANEYLTAEDMVQFKKPKKKRKIRKLKADDLLPENLDEERDMGSRRKKRPYSEEDNVFSVKADPDKIPLIDDNVTDETLDLSTVVIDEDQDIKELSNALSKAKKLKQRNVMTTAPEKVIETIRSGSSVKSMDSKAGNIELNSVAEFCRTLGEIPTYGMSGNRDEEADDMADLEQELLDERQKQELEAQNRGAWNEVDIDEKPAEILMRENEPILEEEPDITLGIAGALKLATKKGYLDKDSKKGGNAPKTSQLQAQSYTIEEKFYEDDKFGKRDRYTGPVQEFKDKNNYKPDVKLEYIDDSGRLLTAKEAFRYLSHKFHGKGPGKNKVDKRMKKLDQDTRLKQMSSTDTPLNTVKLLQAKQKETQSPYIVLSGGNKTLTQTMISKTKPL